MSKAVFLDRDGTLIKDVHYLKDPNDIKIIEGVGKALRLIKNAGYLLFMHTNQSGIGRGFYDWEDVHACNRRMLEMLNLSNDFWNGICIAPESPLERELGYRKPSEKYQSEIILKYSIDTSLSWMVGDKWIDAETGLRANINSALVQTGKEIEPETEGLAKDKNVPICEDLLSFTKSYLLKSE